jgi:hypothetical protein
MANYYNNRQRLGLWLQQPSGTWAHGFGCSAAKRLTHVLSPAGTFSHTLRPAEAASPLVTAREQETRRSRDS